MSTMGSAGVAGGDSTASGAAAGTGVGLSLGDGAAAGSAAASSVAAAGSTVSATAPVVGAMKSESATEALVRLADPAAQVEPDELSEYRVPTLVIACEHDQLFPAEAIREVASLIPGAELYDFKGAGHSSYFEDPTTFNEIVGSFVRKHLP